MTVLDILAKRNADKLRAVEADGASVRYHLRMRDGVVGIIDAFELFDGVSLMFNSIPRGTAEWDDREPCELQIDWCRRGRFELDAANGRAIRLNEGELAFHDERVLKRVMAFPSPLYTGLTLRIDRSVGAASLERALHGRTVDLDGLARRLTGEDGCTVCDPDPSMRALLGSFWDVDERAPLAAAAQGPRTRRPRRRDAELRPARRELPAKEHNRVARAQHEAPGVRSRKRRDAARRGERGRHERLVLQGAVRPGVWDLAHGVPAPVPSRVRRALARDHGGERRSDRAFGRVPQPEQVLRRLRIGLFALAIGAPGTASGRRTGAWTNQSNSIEGFRAASEYRRSVSHTGPNSITDRAFQTAKRP